MQSGRELIDWGEAVDWPLHHLAVELFGLRGISPTKRSKVGFRIRVYLCPSVDLIQIARGRRPASGGRNITQTVCVVSPALLTWSWLRANVRSRTADEPDANFPC